MRLRGGLPGEPAAQAAQSKWEQPPCSGPGRHARPNADRVRRPTMPRIAGLVVPGLAWDERAPRSTSPAASAGASSMRCNGRLGIRGRHGLHSCSDRTMKTPATPIDARAGLKSSLRPRRPPRRAARISMRVLRLRHDFSFRTTATLRRDSQGGVQSSHRRPNAGQAGPRLLALPSSCGADRPDRAHPATPAWRSTPTFAIC
jgi:hypothetical protein